MHSAHSISLGSLTFAWPDSAPLINAQTAVIPAGVTGLIGANGAGKTTLGRLIAGQLHPTSGTITGPVNVWTLPQDLPGSQQTAAEVLGIGPARAALARVLAGEGTSSDYDVIGDDWDIAERAMATLAALGLDAVDERIVDRVVATFSGGQAMRIGLAAARLAGSDWTILDEPTNNLDMDSVAVLIQALASHRGALIVVSHDERFVAEVGVERVAETDELLSRP